jgi:hypothetical protein
VGGRRPTRVEVAGDLAQALALRVLSNVEHELVWDDRRSSRVLSTPDSGRWHRAE